MVQDNLRGFFIQSYMSKYLRILILHSLILHSILHEPFSFPGVALARHTVSHQTSISGREGGLESSDVIGVRKYVVGAAGDYSAMSDSGRDSLLIADPTTITMSDQQILMQSRIQTGEKTKSKNQKSQSQSQKNENLERQSEKARAESSQRVEVGKEFGKNKKRKLMRRSESEGLQRLAHEKELLQERIRQRITMRRKQERQGENARYCCAHFDFRT